MSMAVVALSFDRLKKIPNKYKLLVHGVIRKLEHLLFENEDDTIIPDLVINLCILFYAIKDRFDPQCIGPHMKLDEENQCIVQQSKQSSNSAFLSSIFDSGSYEWKFQINKSYASKDNSGYSQTIGIWEVKSNDDCLKDALKTYFTKFSNRTYGFGLPYGSLCSRNTGSPIRDYEHDVPIKEGDIIEMHCDMELWKLRFKINGKDYGKSFDVKPGKYRAAVNLYYKEDSITLLQ